MKRVALILLSMLAISVGACAPQQATSPYISAGTPETAGKYMVIMGGCNDCHTVGWDESGGNKPVEDWLTGNPVGFRGPWGTTYPSNLRLFVQQLSEDNWVNMLHTRSDFPPMPWANTHQVSDQDLRASYRFIKGSVLRDNPRRTMFSPTTNRQIPLSGLRRCSQARHHSPTKNRRPRATFTWIRPSFSDIRIHPRKCSASPDWAADKRMGLIETRSAGKYKRIKLSHDGNGG